MTHTEHTPGPWKTDGTVVETAHEDSPTGICQMYAYESSDADVKLIAAAPDLLAALKEMLIVSPAGQESKDQKRRRAIAELKAIDAIKLATI